MFTDLERKEVKLYKPALAPRFQPTDPLISTTIVLQKDVESKQDYQGGRKGGIYWEFQVDIYTLQYMKQITKTYCIAQGTHSLRL